MDVASDLPEASSGPAPALPPPQDMLSYDDTVAYEEQRPVIAESDDPRSNPLASRIGHTKIYLLSETSAAAAAATARSAKRKFGEDEEVVFDLDKGVKGSEEEEEIEMDEELGYRTNAILLQGTPISHLPTARLFAYAKHFDTTPLGLEWVSDTTCILVYESKSLARTAFSMLQRPPPASAVPGAEEGEGDGEGYVIAKPIPVALWPPEERINKSLGKGDGLRGVLKMRWARFDDVKKKGAKRESEFYRRHGEDAGKELFNGRDLPPAKRQRYENGGSDAAMDRDMEKLRLDAELAEFLKESDPEEGKEEESRGQDETPLEPVSKMRSDYIGRDGRTLLDRFSDPVDSPGLLKDRIVAPLPRRARGGRGSGRRGYDDPEPELNSSSLWERIPLEGEEGRRGRRGGGGGEGRGSREGRRRGGRRGDDRPKKSQQELDDELDAFLRQE